MLQRIHDSLGKWVVVIVLGLIAFTFIFWGVDFGLTGITTFAAKVNGEDVSLVDFDRELQARQNQYQEIYRAELPDDVRRELRRGGHRRSRAHYGAASNESRSKATACPTQRSTQSIRDIAAFQVDGQFSLEVYEGLLANQGLTPTSFETLQRESLEVGDLQGRHRRLHLPDAGRVSPLHRALQPTARGCLRAVRPRGLQLERHDRRCGDHGALRQQSSELPDRRDRRSRVPRALAGRRCRDRRADRRGNCARLTKRSGSDSRRPKNAALAIS